MSTLAASRTKATCRCSADGLGLRPEAARPPFRALRGEAERGEEPADVAAAAAVAAATALDEGALSSREDTHAAPTMATVGVVEAALRGAVAAFGEDANVNAAADAGDDVAPDNGAGDDDAAPTGTRLRGNRCCFAMYRGFARVGEDVDGDDAAAAAAAAAPVALGDAAYVC